MRGGMATQRKWRGWAGLALLAWLAGCAPGGDLPHLPPPDQAYRLGPGDEVRVITYGESSLTGSFRVDDSGRIDLPLLGQVKAAGLTTSQLADHVELALRTRKLLTDPSVTIESALRRPVFVLGEVQHPGRYAYEPGMTVLSAVAIAGGFTYRAVKRRVEIVRQGADGPMDGQAGAGDPVAPGDVINVLERHI